MKKNDEKANDGVYRTKQVTLELFDAGDREAVPHAPGAAPPADPAVAHDPKSKR